jgi:uncharacterized protein (TIGR02391 family)
MIELPTAIPDFEVLLALEPEELGAKMLFLLRSRTDAAMFNLVTLRGELWSQSLCGRLQYSPNRKQEIDLAVAEALAWLEAQGLIVPSEGMNGQNGWRHLSRRARKFEDETDFANFAVARRLPKESLHPRIAQPVWQAFMRGEFDVAVFQATKAVEVYVREKTGLVDELGTKLMRKAFEKNTGPLTDPSADEGEREAMAHLFAGAIGVFKNPQSHRDVNVDDPTEAMEIIMLANRLLKIVDARVRARTET